MVMPVTIQHDPMLQRNLLYTGVTRGRKLVVLVAQPKAVAIAVQGAAGAAAMVEAAGVAGGELRVGRGDRVSFAIIRGGNGRRHEVDFGDDPIQIDVTASTQTVQITVEAIKDGVAPERRRFATIALPREEFMTALGADVGLVHAIDPEAAELVVDFDGQEVVYESGELDELVLAYATTAHKAQRSEYPAVAIPTPPRGGARIETTSSRFVQNVSANRFSSFCQRSQSVFYSPFSWDGHRRRQVRTCSLGGIRI